MRYLDKNELREALHLGAKQCEALMKMSGFPLIKVGNKMLVEETALHEYLTSRGKITLDYRGISKPIGTRRLEEAPV